MIFSVFCESECVWVWGTVPLCPHWFGRDTEKQAEVFLDP